MVFMVRWSIDPDKWHTILRIWGSMTPAQRADVGAGVKLVGRWHDSNGRTGVGILESSDTVALSRYLNQWNALCHLEVTPVVSDDESAVLAKEVIARVGG